MNVQCTKGINVNSNEKDIRSIGQRSTFGETSSSTRETQRYQHVQATHYQIVSRDRPKSFVFEE